jgi:hypothetical protein
MVRDIQLCWEALMILATTGVVPTTLTEFCKRCRQARRVLLQLERIRQNICSEVVGVFRVKVPLTIHLYVTFPSARSSNFKLIYQAQRARGDKQNDVSIGKCAIRFILLFSFHLPSESRCYRLSLVNLYINLLFCHGGSNGAC